MQSLRRKIASIRVQERTVVVLLRVAASFLETAWFEPEYVARLRDSLAGGEWLPARHAQMKLVGSCLKDPERGPDRFERGDFGLGRASLRDRLVVVGPKRVAVAMELETPTHKQGG